MVNDEFMAAPSYTAGMDTFYLILPTPGQAFWSATVPIGTFPDSATSWLPTSFPGAFGSGQLFGATTTDRAVNVNAFRYASLCAGIYCTSNEMQYGGSITVWKAPFQQALAGMRQVVPTVIPTNVDLSNMVVNGLEATSGVPIEKYASSFDEGCYTVSASTEPDFEFQDIVEGYTQLPAGGISTRMFGVLNGDYLGMGTTQGIIIRVSTPAGATNAALLRVWACTEYKVVPTSFQYKFASSSPPLDELALETYRRVSRELPLAVPSAENSSFWQRVMGIVNAISTGASFIPGPVGAIGKGVGMVTNALSSLFM